MTALQKTISYQPNSQLEFFGLGIFNLLVENSHECFFVGGTVRDIILKKKVTDLDMATDAAPGKIAQILSGKKIQVDISNRRFGLAIVQKGSKTAELATFRTDQYSQSRYPTVQFVGSAKTDSARRDFTINALYLKPNSGKVLDFHSGLSDIQQKKIRFIGNPRRRIEEDPLRILRAYRFCATLGFTMEKNTEWAIKKYFYLINKLTKSRIEKEAEKIAGTTEKKKYFALLENKKSLDKYF